MGRRDLPSVPYHLQESDPDLYKFLLALQDSESGGTPGGASTTTPTTVQAGDTADIGSEDLGWATADHEHAVETGSAVGLANTNAEGSGTALARANHTHKRDVRVAKAGSDVGASPRNRLNFADSSHISITIADDSGNDETDISMAIVANSVGNTELRQGGACSVIGRSANSTGNVADISASGNGQYLQRNSNALSFAAIAAADVPAAFTGWTDDGTIVRLTTNTDQVKVGGSASTVDGALNVFCNAGTARLTISDHGGSALPLLRLRQSSGTETSPTDTGAAVIGRIEAQGREGSAYATSSYVVFESGATWTGSSHPSTFAFFSTAVGSTTPIEVLRSGASAVTEATLTVNGSGSNGTATLMVNGPGNFNDHSNDHTSREVLGIYRYRADSTAPNAGLGAIFAFYLEGSSSGTMVNAASIASNWENNQTNGTTDRDANFIVSVIVDNTLTERLRITSAGVVRPGADNVGDLGTSSLRWKDLWIARVLAGTASGAAGAAIINAASDAGSAHFLLEQAVASATGGVITTRKSRGSLSSKADVNAGDILLDMDCQAYRSSFSNTALLRIDVESNGSLPGGRFQFYTQNDLMSGALTLRFHINNAGNVVVGTTAGALATTATNGFMYIPGGAGAPTGVPALLPTGTYPLYIDTTGAAGARLHAYYGGAWNAL